MDLTTLLLLFGLAAGGIAYDAYEHPKTLIVKVIQRGNDTGTGLDKGVVIGVVENELDRMARVPSLLAQPHIRPSEEKGFVEALGDATGTGPFLDVIASQFQEHADSLNIGVYTDGGKFKAFVYGAAAAVPSRDGRYDITIAQRDGEPNIETLRRAIVAGAQRIDPYLTMLYLLSESERTNDRRHSTAALAMSRFTKQRIPNARLLLVARMDNVEGLLHLREGDLDQAAAAFADGLTYVPADYVGPTPVILRLNRAFIELARGDTAGATADLEQAKLVSGNFDKLVGMNVASTEEQPFIMTAPQVDILRAVAETLAAGIAIREKRLDDAEALLRAALLVNPHQLGAMSMQADIAAIRGDAAAEATLRKAIVQRSLLSNPYLELAFVHATLSFTADAVAVKSTLNVIQ